MVNPRSLLCLSIGAAAISFAAMVPAVAQVKEVDAAHQSPLGEQGSAEWQTLLTRQRFAPAVSFNDTTIPGEPLSTYGRLFAWSNIALDTTAIDHTPPAPGQNYTFGQAFGPPRAARAMAIAHIAMFEAVNAIVGKFHSYTGLKPVGPSTSTAAGSNPSMDAAIAQSMHDALVFVYPSQKSRLDALLAYDQGFFKANSMGKALGAAAAQSIIALRSNDGSQTEEPIVGVNFFPLGGVPNWAVDPISQSTVALGANWAQVKPFVIPNATSFRPPGPPPVTSQKYTDAFNETKTLGGDPNFGTPTTRTAEETLEGIFWTYDGVPNICAPPRLYNQIAHQLALSRKMQSVEDTAQMFAVLNTAEADAGLAAWEAKWHYQFWRPITGIRNELAIGNPNIVQDPNWTPLGAQATNTTARNFTPPFPAYPSGHATFGGAIFEVLKSYFKDNESVTFISDEFNGRNFSDTGVLMPLAPVTFPSLTAADKSNADSRIWVGVHWQPDADDGDAAGIALADYVLSHAFLPVNPNNRAPTGLSSVTTSALN
jgi:hypothetical protein